MIVLKAAIKFFPLGISQDDRLRYRCQAIPNVLRELNALSYAKFENIGHGNLSHGKDPSS